MLPYFFSMISEEIREELTAVIAETLPTSFLVDIKLAQGGNRTLSIKVDTDKGITMSECETVNRALGAHLEEHPRFNFKYRLEVSSPGVGSPLKLLRQYRKEIGRHLKVTFHENLPEIKGLLEEVTEESILLTPIKFKGKKKRPIKAESGPKEITFAEIKEAKVIII
ncbi:MAG: ribosome maturation factor, partial [Bacteroidota bacterium]